MRSTKIKQATEDILKNSKTPVSVPEILEALNLKKISPDEAKPLCFANKTTIYRILQSLLVQELVLELDFGEGKKRYEFVKLGHHHHLICKKCKKIEHVELSEIEKTLVDSQRKISRKSNFKVTDHTIELFGLCQRCQ